MGLLDNLAGQILGGGKSQGDLAGALTHLLGSSEVGGLSGLVQQFASKGLGDIVNSWVGTGQNLPISPDQITHGLGSDLLNQLASKSGLKTQDISSQLSQLLPQVVDKLTPQGKIPQGDIVSQGLGVLKSLLG
jgi:uncharacterized protein YidB (DUF937 family)